MRHFPKIIFLFIVVAVGCHEAPMNFEGGAPSDVAMRKAPQPEETVGRKLIKQGIIEFETTDLEETREAIIQSLSQFSGYVASDEESSYSDRRTNTLVVRVPADNFDAFLAAATEGVEHFDSKDINVTDVTEEYVDAEARLTTRKALETRYRELLKQARTVTEILQIEKQIAQQREEIEAVEGRLRYLSSQVSYATLTITFYQRVTGESAFGRQFKEAFRNGGKLFILFFVALTNLWPFILVALIGVAGVRFYRKRRAKEN